ncbi:autotransporter outer membrane beta-barrel domain-containing protein [Paraburkholderia bryophila]|uniref:autotransporter family protein n=1 Tax=Paraburkholderia bryophila TaxID=420952 RepID=UPI002349E8CA|nr:autotransporter outer membrane beta-barrel domain-containing protein [Paraburkholderia bryophila]WCM21718.1 autotransporter outer membrane beta-barrel domain-containing protein [Paraburkholderia bryophila]
MAPVLGGTNGIEAVHIGTGALNIAVKGDVTGTGNDGIVASNDSTDSLIATAAGTHVMGASDGIAIDSAGAGAMTIAVNGNVTGTTGNGISAVANGSGAIAINLGAASLAQGGTDGVAASSIQSPITISNAGTIQNLSGQSSALAIATAGGPTSISNAGLVTGTVYLSDGGSSFSNTGTWNTAGGTNQFGAGSGNSVTNGATGTIVAANTPTTAQTTTFVGLGTFANAGTITMQDGLAGDRMVINGNFVGQKGTVLLDTYLGSDNSPSDRLVVQGGTASGSTTLLVASAGGNGAQTTGSGIEVVQTPASSANAFTLGKPVEAGAYQYLLYRGGAGADAADQNWYLRSQLDNPASPPSPGPGPSPAPQPGPVAYRPGVAAYTMTPLLNEEYGFTVLGTLHQRVGDVPGAIDPRQNDAGNGVWGRVNASSFDADALGRFSASSATYFAQFGKDWTLNQPQEGGSTHAGVTLTFGDTSATFNDSLRAMAGLDTQTGTVSTQAQSLGGYWTRYLKDGTYFDSVGQVTWYHNRFGGQDGSASQHGVGAVLSQEVGKPLRIGSTPVAIEPQAQLMYQYLSLGDFSDTVSPVSGTHTNALRGRVGVRIYGADLPNTDSHDVLSWARPYLTVDVLHDFLRPGQTVVGGTPLNPSLARTSFDVGGGVTAAAGKHGELYAHGGYQRSLGSGYSQGFYGQLAYRYMW